MIDTACLTALPAPLRYTLLSAAVGGPHLARAGLAAARAAGQHPDRGAALLALAGELFLAAWLCDPLDGGAAANLIQFGGAMPGPGKDVAACLKAVTAMTRDKTLSPRLARLEESGGEARLLGLLDEELAGDPGNLRLARTLCDQACLGGDFARARGIIANLAKMAVLAPLIPALSGDVFFLEGDYAKAASLYLEAEARFPGFFAQRAGEAHVRAGSTDEGLALMHRALGQGPWRVNAALRLSDLLGGVHEAKAALPGPLAILLYSYNSPDLLDQTLSSLFASDLRFAPGVIVRLLLNGPNAAAKAVADTWRERFGEKFAVIALPVNVGAAPARNWLASLEEVQTSGFAVYLDDDVRLPGDWLGRLGAAVAAYPGAGLYGCKVADNAHPARLQHADLGVLDPVPGEELFSLSEAHLDGFDHGQFTYLRPCASVTGCCHMFRTESLNRCGPFDIRFAPTQYDDLDHDLAMTLCGEGIVYQGHLGVAHKKASGSILSKSRVESANAAANMRKLKGKYAQADIGTIRERVGAAQEADWLEKIERIGRAFSGERG